MLHGVEQSACKPEPVEKTESKCQSHAQSAAGGGGAQGVLQRDDNDARRDHRFDDSRRQPDDVADRQHQRDGVRDGEDRDDDDEFAPAIRCEDERGDEKEMIPAFENVVESVGEVFAEDRCG